MSAFVYLLIGIVVLLYIGAGWALWNALQLCSQIKGRMDVVAEDHDEKL